MNRIHFLCLWWLVDDWEGVYCCLGCLHYIYHPLFYFFFNDSWGLNGSSCMFIVCWLMPLTFLRWCEVCSQSNCFKQFFSRLITKIEQLGSLLPLFELLFPGCGPRPSSLFPWLFINVCLQVDDSDRVHYSTGFWRQIFESFQHGAPARSADTNPHEHSISGAERLYQTHCYDWKVGV